MKKDAYLSEDRRYRYALWRIWNESLSYAMFIGLNPSTADEENDDATITRCIGFAKSWGYGGFAMANLFAYRSTDPTQLQMVENPVGPENNDWLVKLAKSAGVVVAAWGNSGSLFGRSQAVAALLPEMMCLKVNGTGEPAHPLYQPASAILVRYAQHNNSLQRTR
jgi:hypothetical protein